jgi:hypothetical protein
MPKHSDLAAALLALFSDSGRLAKPLPGALPRAGDACVAVYSADGRPYAAKVDAVTGSAASAGSEERKSSGRSFTISASVAAPASVSVTYSQYGNSETLPATEVLALAVVPAAQ